MKKLLLLLSLCLSIVANAQTANDSLPPVNVNTDSIIASIPPLLEDMRFRMRGLDRYKMYPTQNIYTFLKLDTMTGRIEQVQWSLDDDKEFSVTLNYRDLTGYDSPGCGTFELYPTQNMYQFLLLNKVTGETWHVQWGMESNKRWIQKIY